MCISLSADGDCIIAFERILRLYFYTRHVDFSINAIRELSARRACISDESIPVIFAIPARVSKSKIGISNFAYQNLQFLSYLALYT